MYKVIGAIFCALVLVFSVFGAEEIKKEEKDFKRGMCFYAPFDGTDKAEYAKGDKESAGGTTPENCFVEGKRGRAIKIGESGRKTGVVYGSKGNIRNEEGTVSLWVKTDWPGFKQEKKERCLFAMSSGVYNVSMLYHWQGSIIFAHYNGAYKESGGWDYGPAFQTKDWLTDEWYHITIAWKGTFKRIFFNGELVGEKESEQSLLMAEGFVVGSDASLMNVCDGYIDDFKIWDRILSENEIKEVYKEWKTE